MSAQPVVSAFAEKVIEHVCRRKRRHDTFTDALQHLADIYRTQKRHRRRLQVYTCRFCAGYHVGHGRTAGPANPTPSETATTT